MAAAAGERELFLGVDVGTQGTKGVLVAAEGPTRRVARGGGPPVAAAAGGLQVAAPDGGSPVVARAGRSYGLIEGLPPGAAEQHPEYWWRAVIEVVRELLGRAGVDPARVRGIGVSGQQHGLVVVDAKGQVLRAAKLWCDTSTAREAAELSERLGRAVPAGFTASKIVWLARHEPEAWRRTALVLLPHDFINFRLTGRAVMEAGDASGTGFFDPVTRAWDERAVTAVDAGLPSRLPPLLDAGEPAGELSAEAAEALGLPAGIPVAAGGGDNMMSAIGSGATRAGVVVMSLGTSGTVFCHSDAPVVDREGLIAPFCGSAGGWLPLLCVMNATGVTEEVREAFLPGDEQGLERLTEDAAEIPIGCEGVTFIPFLHGERVPDLPGATASLLGLRPGLLRPDLLFRAAIEGVTCNLALGIERLRALAVPVDSLRLVGGAARNPLWRRIAADLLDLPIVCPAEPESAAFGAALQALWTVRRREQPELGIDEIAAPRVALAGDPVEPDPARAPACRQLLERFRCELARLFPERA